MKPGRLQITCIGAENVHRKDQFASKTNLNPYLVFTVANGNCEHIRETSIQANSGQNPSFGNETVTFDLPDLSSRDDSIHIQLVDRGSDEDNLLLGETTLSIKDVVNSQGKRNEWTLRLKLPGDISSNSKLRIATDYQTARVGLLSVDVCDCNLNVHTKSGNLFATVRIENGPIHKVRLGQSETAIRLWVEEENAFKSTTFALLAETAGRFECRVIGQAVQPLLALINGLPTRRLKMDLCCQDGQKVGELVVTISFVPAGKLTASIKSGSNLRGSRPFSSLEPYIQVKTVGGKHPPIVKRTKTQALADDGTAAWNENLTVPIIDAEDMMVQVLDDDPIRNGAAIIGTAKLNILPALEGGTVREQISIENRNEFGVQSKTGEISIELTFEHPDTPQAKRSQIEANAESEEENESPESGSNSVSIDDTIRNSFKQIDLDRNGYIGAAEIKHVLICMGESPSDEEIDMMISMLDFNGDGQISLREFTLMVKDPDPASDDFAERAKKSLAAHAASPPQQHRRKELELRNLKRSVLSQFVRTNGITFADLKMLWKTFAARNEIISEGITHTTSLTIDYQTFCTLAPKVEETDESRRVFDLVDHDNSGKVDVRELILCLANFTEGAAVNERVKLMFDLYDSDRSGDLSSDEIEGILIANHLHTAVSGKVQTLMKCCAGSGAKQGTVTMDQLLVAAAKYPNLLLPKHEEWAG